MFIRGSTPSTSWINRKSRAGRVTQIPIAPRSRHGPVNGRRIIHFLSSPSTSATTNFYFSPCVLIVAGLCKTRSINQSHPSRTSSTSAAPDCNGGPVPLGREKCLHLSNNTKHPSSERSARTQKAQKGSLHILVSSYHHGRLRTHCSQPAGSLTVHRTR